MKNLVFIGSAAVLLTLGCGRTASAAPPGPKERAERAREKAVAAIADAEAHVDEVAAEVKAAPRGEAKTLAAADVKAARAAIKQALRRVRAGDRLFKAEGFAGARDAFDEAAGLAAEARTLARQAHRRLR